MREYPYTRVIPYSRCLEHNQLLTESPTDNLSHFHSEANEDDPVSLTTGFSRGMLLFDFELATELGYIRSLGAVFLFQDIVLSVHQFT